MKSQTSNPVVPSARCAYHTAGGRQCRLPVCDMHSGLCPRHLAEQQQIEAADHYGHLTRNYHDFQTAQGINHSLHNLYELLAQNRISARRAAVLSYISSLLLRTLPQIDADNAAGIKFRPASAANPTAANATAANTNPEPEPNSASIAQPSANSCPDSANAWDPSNPEPDPEKKPS